jgi:RecA/RadA recombinase
MIVGQPGSGKTMLAIQTLAQGQQQYNGKLLGMFLDSEEATTTMRLANLGVKYPKIKPYTDITVEKVFKVIEALALFKQEKNIIETPGVVVWDSIANTLTQKERETDDPNTVIGYKARLLSILVPKYVAKCAQNNICFLSVNQLRDNLQMGQYAPAPELKMMGANKTIPGGNILRFNAFQLVEMKVKSIISPGKAEDSSKYGFEGTIVKVKCVKNKLFSPNVEVEIVGSFINGFSNFWTNYNFLKNVKRLNSGAWNYLVSLPNTKFRAKDAVETYNTDPEFKAAFDQEVKDAINIEIVEKYK